MRRVLPPDADLDDLIRACRSWGWSADRIAFALQISPSTYRRRVRAMREAEGAPADRPPRLLRA